VPGCYFSDCLVCPNITIQLPKKSVKAGEEIIIIANSSGGSNDYTFKWKVNGGKIIRGQGKTAITVKVNKTLKNNLTVELKIGGTCPFCIDTFKESLQIIPKS
jgi:hypothetical protein